MANIANETNIGKIKNYAPVQVAFFLYHSQVQMKFLHDVKLV